MRFIISIFFVFVFCSEIFSQQKACSAAFNVINSPIVSGQYCVGNIITVKSFPGVMGFDYEWTYNDTSFCNSYLGNWTIPHAGIYNIKLIVTDQNTFATCTYNAASFIVYPNPNTQNFDIGPDKTICDGQMVTMGETLQGCTYLWSPNGETSEYITVTAPGIYKVVAKSVNNCGKDSSQMEVKLAPNPVVNLGGNKTVCSGIPLTLDAGAFQSATYLWSTGATTQTISVTQRDITISVMVDSSGCVGEDQATISDCPVEPQVPSAFSPNGDGQNEILYVRGNNLTELNIKIYNRLGTLVFESSSAGTGWDGSYNGTIQEPDVYVYILTAKLSTGATFNKSGSIMLLK